AFITPRLSLNASAIASSSVNTSVEVAVALCCAGTPNGLASRMMIASRQRFRFFIAYPLQLTPGSASCTPFQCQLPLEPESLICRSPMTSLLCFNVSNDGINEDARRQQPG